MEFPLSVRLLAAVLMAACICTLLLLRRQPRLPPPTARLNTVQASPAPTIASAPMSTPTPSPRPIRRGPVSPYEISRYLKEHRNDRFEFSMAEFWQRLDIDKGDVTWQGCDVDFFRLPLDNEPGSEVILRLFSPGLCRYLFFKSVVKSNRQAWKFLGVIDKHQK